MTRKDYVKFANIIKQNYEVSTGPVKFVLRDMIDSFAQVFSADNPNFDRSRFIEACGI